MADDTNEDSWLYGTSNPDSTTNEEDKIQSSIVDGEHATSEPEEQDEGGEADQTGDRQQSPDSNQKENKDDEEDPADEMEEEDRDDEKEKDAGDFDLDDSDDDINVVIGDIKSGQSYNIKQRSNLLASTAVVAQEKSKPSAGKFNIEEFESVGTINGIPAHEFSIDSLDEKPWQKPGADITDYFNYGFNEDTWRSYCERQKRIRLNDSGVGLQGLAVGATAPPQPGIIGIPRRAGPPPGRKMIGNIDVIAKENVIQVMTAERREYSRPGGNLPSNAFGEEPYFDQESYNYGYEPTQDSQWLNENPNWIPSGIKELTPGPQMVPPPMGIPHPMGMRPPMGPPPMGMGPPHMGMGPGKPKIGMGMGPPTRMIHPGKDRDRDRERDRDRDRERRDRDGDWGDRERDRDWDRERDRDRDRERDTDRRSRERGKSEESERASVAGGREESPTASRDRERRRAERHRERDKERSSSRRDRSRSRERSRRRSKSRDRERERKSRDKKKSHRKDKEDSE